MSLSTYLSVLLRLPPIERAQVVGPYCLRKRVPTFPWKRSAAGPFGVLVVLGGIMLLAIMPLNPLAFPAAFGASISICFILFTWPFRPALRHRSTPGGYVVVVVGTDGKARLDRRPLETIGLPDHSLSQDRLRHRSTNDRE